MSISLFGKDSYYKFFECDEYIYGTKKAVERIAFFKKKIFPKIKPFLASPILDCGCGGGIFSFFLEKKKFKVIGVDISALMIKRALEAKKRFGFTSKFLTVDLKKEKLKHKFSTVLFLGNVLWDIKPKDLKELLRNIRLKRGGHIIFDYIDNLSLIKKKLWKRVIIEKRKIGNFLILTLKMKKDICRLFLSFRHVFFVRHYIWNKEILKESVKEIADEVKTFEIGKNRFISIFKIY